jgi:hypothetical protein
MANIIEQQDLLKGLPDARLSLLLQSPDASIPPFLVAAEAQRRQSIRQQFAGDGGKESVVDTLTKQLSNVPQNIQAPMRTPPQMPPPMQPQMAGIGALPQGQQQMANGGPVRRFASEGFVYPSNPFDYVRENYPISSLPNTIANAGNVLGEAWNSPTAKQISDRLLMETGRAADFLTLNPYTSQALGIDPKSVTERRQRNELEVPASTEDTIAIPSASGGPKTRGYPTNRDPEPTPNVSKPPNPDTGKADTSVENKYKSQQAELRGRLESLYGADEPSNWEDAQKWFAMSSQIMNPDATLLEGLVNAGNVYAQAEGEQARSQREGDRDLQEALLKWDMNELEYNRAREQAAIDDERSSTAAALKARTDIATGQLDDLYRQQRDVAEQLRKIEESIVNGADPALLEGQKAALSRQFNAIGGKISTYEGFIGDTYGFPTIPTVDIATGTIK